MQVLEAREQLRSQAERLERLVARSHPPGPGVDARPDAWYATIEDAVLDLYGTLPAGAHDSEVAQLFYYLTELRRRLGHNGESPEQRARADLSALKLGDVVRRLERRLQHDALEVPEDAARFVYETLNAVDVSDQARLLGVSTKTLATWKRGGRVQQNKDRVRLVAQLVSYLRTSMTQTGVLMWFDDESDLLGGVTPLSMVASGEPGAWSRLLSYARGGRAQLAD